MNQPNILWVCSDQQRFDMASVYGNPFVKTPSAERLAEEGTLFEYAFSQSPVCSPSRASFLTGRYPRTTRCRQNGQAIPPDERLVTKVLAENGYICGLSGKLHIATCSPRFRPAGEERIDDGYAEFHWMHHPDPHWTTQEYAHWLRERGEAYRRHSRPESRFLHTTMPAELHPTTWCAQKAINFIEAHEGKSSPWLFSVNFFDPHHPFDPPEEYLERYMSRLDEIPLPNYTDGELENKPVFQQANHHGAYNQPRNLPYSKMDENDHRCIRAGAWAMCDLIDDQLGRMMDALEATGQRENTIVIFMSDHGEMLGDHGIYLKGPFFYEEAVRVPLIISCPSRFQKGVKSGALTELTDIAPMLLDAAGIEREPGMQGRSLYPLLTGETADEEHREDVYSEYYNAMPHHQNPQAHMTMVRTGTHKLVAAHGLDVWELYDLENDPGEVVNRWNDPDYARVQTEMTMRLADRMAWTVDPLPERIGAY